MLLKFALIRANLIPDWDFKSNTMVYSDFIYFKILLYFNLNLGM